MCGISGIVRTRKRTESVLPIIDRMNRLHKERGPDATGSWEDDFAALGHTRLAIQDLSQNGRQPLANEDGTILLTFNGEIYNFRDLRKDLISRGHHFRTRTDTEVIVHLYEEEGDRCVDQLVGMFAFGLWDTRRKRLLLARDRTGEKPLYYAVSNCNLAFGSEVRALLQVPWVGRELDCEAVASQMVYQSTPAPLTFFKDIRNLPPASTLAWERGQVATSRYWSLDFSKRRNWRLPDALEAYDSHVRRSVRDCLVADVPLGVMLSGGVDSSTIAAFARDEHTDVRTFCVGHNAPGQPDPEFARATRASKHLHTRHENIQFVLNGLPDLPGIVSHYGEPINNSAILYADQLASQMKESATVVLSGNAADEVFGGYRSYTPARVRNWATSALGRVPPSLAIHLSGPGGRLKRVLERGRIPIHQWRASGLTTFGRAQMSRFCTKSFADSFCELNPGRHVEQYANECNPQTLLDTIRYTDLMVYHRHAHGAIPDTSGMRCGLEIRSPLLDHRIIEFAATLPEKLLIPSLWNDRRNKLIMKESLLRYLPKDLVFARKLGFGYNINIRDFFRGPWRKAVGRRLLDSAYLDLGIFSREGAQWALENSFGDAWMLLTFSVWADLFLFEQSVEALSAELASGIDETHGARSAA